MSPPLVLLCVCACVSLSVAAADQPQPQPKYSDRFDSVDVDRVLNNRRLLNNYVQCLLGRRACPPEGAELKKNLPDAIKTKCAKCTDSQRYMAVKIAKKMEKDFPAEWKTIIDKWDPKGVHIKEFEQEIAKWEKEKKFH